METQFTWIAFYQEFAQRILPYRNNIQPLLDFIYALKDDKGKSFTTYIHDSKGNKVTNIDPFSVIAICNRNYTWENRKKICTSFKRFLSIQSEVPTDFSGIPTVDNRRSFFYNWNDWSTISPLWDLFEKVVNGQSFEQEFQAVLRLGFPIGMLTMAFYWIAADSYLSLDGRNFAFLVEYGMQPKKYKNAKEYFEFLEQVRDAMRKGIIPYKSFPEFSRAAFEKKIDIETIQQSNTTMTTNYNDIIALLQANKNLILTGAPGIGKTFLATELAHELGADDKYICKVQFHPSYDYTDFVEGIRPMKDSSFRRTDGEFKAFCKRALLAQNTDTDMLADLNSDPKVWKVSLKGTYDNDVRRDCLDNGYIRIGWPAYGNIDFSEYNPAVTEGKSALKAFQSSMQIGDIIVSCYTENLTDAIGIVTGDYDYREDGGDYPRYRTVKWLVKDIRENIMEINGGKRFTLSTVYLSNIKPVAALELAKKNSVSSKIPTNKPFVFIIDEINRGELSKIFGELFGAIEIGYRGEKGRVRTQYQNLITEGDPYKDGFFVPENVYIIGTMNDIDRSVESMDFAMRRRFAWKEVTARESYDAIIGNNTEFKGDKVEVKKRMERLNAEIEKRLGRSFQIGAAYFLKLNDNDFDALWRNHLEGLIFEYFRGERDAQKKVNELHAIYNGEQSDTNIGQ